MNAVLGTMTWGPHGQTTKEPAIKQMRSMLEHRGKIVLDTARVYQSGETEQLIGEILEENPDLRQVTEIHTKASPMLTPLTKKGVRDQLDASLAALKVDSIDLYYIHSPDMSVPFEETLEAFNDAYESKKIKRFGISNFSSWNVARVQAICKERNFVKPEVYQGCYNVLTRAIEPELVPCLRHYGMSFYAYNPLAGGLLSGRYKTLNDVEEASSGRFSGEFDFVSKGLQDEKSKKLQGAGKMIYRRKYANKVNFKAIETILQAKKDDKLTMVEIALGWLSHHSALSSSAGDAVLFGASKIEHCESNFKALKKPKLSKELIDACDDAGMITKAVAFPYFHENLRQTLNKM